MLNKRSNAELGEALNLIEMLEQLSTFLSQSNLSSQEIAWGGYLQTITEIKRKLLAIAENDGSRENIDTSEKASDDVTLSDSEVFSSTIAKRIKKLPPVRSGRVRELGTGSSNGEYAINQGETGKEAAGSKNER